MNGFGARYFFARSSKKRSGSNSKAVRCTGCRQLPLAVVEEIDVTIWPPEIRSTMYGEQRVHTPRASGDEERLTTRQRGPDPVSR